MKQFIGILLIVTFLGIGQIGCSGRFWGGAAAGAVGTGAAYEYQKKKQMDRLEEDFEQGNITKEEYLRRKEEIQEGSLIY
jgi:hypothetical protein